MYLFYSLTLLQIPLTILAVRCTREWLQQGYITRASIATLENHGEEQADADADAEHTQLAIIRASKIQPVQTIVVALGPTRRSHRDAILYLLHPPADTEWV